MFGIYWTIGRADKDILIATPNCEAKKIIALS